MNAALTALRDDNAMLTAALKAAGERAAATAAELATARAEAAVVKAEVTSQQALIAHLKLEIMKLNRARFGPSSERTARLLDQLELQLEELEASASEDELAAEQAAARSTTTVAGFERQKPSRKPFPEHLPRERVVEPAPTACACCGGSRLAKLGEDITETLEVIPRQWFVIQHVREKFSCRDCETISQPPAPFHVIPRGLWGPSLLAMILFEKFGQHQPLNRQAERYEREGVPLSLSTLADQVGACTSVLRPLHDLIEAHALAATRLHGDDTTVPVLAKGSAMSADVGSMSAMTAPSADRPRRRRCSIIRATAGASTRRGIWKTLAAYSRPTPIAALPPSMVQADPPAPSSTRCAGRTAGASSSNWPISPPAPARRPRARPTWSSRPWPWRRSAASTPCSISSGPSTASPPTSGRMPARP